MATPNLVEHYRQRGFPTSLLVYNQQDITLLPGFERTAKSHWPDPYLFWGQQEKILAMSPRELRDAQVDALVGRLRMQYELRNRSNGQAPMVVAARAIHPVLLSESERARRNMGIDPQSSVPVEPMNDNATRYPKYDKGMDEMVSFWGSVGNQPSAGGIY